MVTSENWKKYSVGQTGDEIAGEGIFIRVPLMVSDEATIQDIESGKQELSAGYVCDLDFTAGVTPTGEAYDAVQVWLSHSRRSSNEAARLSYFLAETEGRFQ
jgi:hypothetical protein